MKNISLRAGRFLTLALLLTGLGLGSCKKDDTTTVYGNWQPSSTYSGVARSEAVSFVINGVAYAGTGRNTVGTPLKDFYSFDPTKGGWSPLTPMPTAAAARYGAVAFAANGKGYVGTGNDGNGNYLADFWEFDPAGTTSVTVGSTTTTTVGVWRQVASLTTAPNGTARFSAVAGSINNIGFVGCGFDGNNQNNFFKYNPATNVWSAFASPFPGDKRTGAVAFVLANQFYVATGTNNNANVSDVYAYNPQNDAWTMKHYLRTVSTATENYDNLAVARSQAVAFTVNDKAYITTGGSTLLSCYEYNAADDTWTLKNPYVGSVRNNAVGFGIGNYGYVGLGYNGSNRFDNFYRFAPNDAQE